jgi:hypothetical protein
MFSLIYYRCSDPLHLAAPSRCGLGGIVFRHGTAAYCDGVGVDAQHHWIPTGGVAIESLFGKPHAAVLGTRDDRRLTAQP